MWSPALMSRVANPMIWLYRRTGLPAAMSFTAILCPGGTRTAVRTSSRNSIVPAGMSTRAMTTSSAGLRRMTISAAWSMASLLTRQILAPGRLVLPQRRQTLRERGLHEEDVDAVGDRPEPFRAVVPGPGVVPGHESRRLAMPLAGRNQVVDRLQVARMIELRRDAEEVGEVEVAEPDDVDAGQ